jgi:hypothetical protein
MRNLAVSIDVYRPYELNPGNHLAQLGDVMVYERVIVTPVGQWPMRGAQFLLAQQPAVVRKTTTVGIVLAVISCVLALALVWLCGVGLVFLFGLFFLAMKEDRLVGPAIVVVRSGHMHYQAQVHLQSPSQISWLVNNVNYCQGLAARA